jgi:hypothetical protein
MRQLAEGQAKIVGPQHDCQNRSPKTQVKEPDREEPRRNPRAPGEGMLLDAYFLHNSLPSSTLPRFSWRLLSRNSTSKSGLEHREIHSQKVKEWNPEGGENPPGLERTSRHRSPAHHKGSCRKVVQEFLLLARSNCDHAYHPEYKPVEEPFGKPATERSSGADSPACIVRHMDVEEPLAEARLPTSRRGIFCC